MDASKANANHVISAIASILIGKGIITTTELDEEVKFIMEMEIDRNET